MFRIPSIHNYCNRWCERCALSAECAFYYAHYKQGEVGPEDWVADLPRTEQKPEFETLNLPDISQLEGHLAQKEAQGSFNPNDSPLLKHFAEWHKKYGEALQLLDNLWHEEENTSGAYLGESRALIAHNAREVLLYYRNFIGPKLHRALGGKFDDLRQPPVEQSDWNGSAKVAILAFQHIISAQKDVLLLFPLQKPFLRVWLRFSEELLEHCLETFPHAKKFQRPGFDVLGTERIYGRLEE